MLCVRVLAYEGAVCVRPCQCAVVYQLIMCVSGMVLYVNMLHISHMSWGNCDYVIVCQCVIIWCSGVSCVNAMVCPSICCVSMLCCAVCWCAWVRRGVFT